MLAGTLEIEMLANMARLSKDMDDIKRTVGSSMFAIEKAVGQAKAALGALAVGLSVGAIIAQTKSLIDAADAMNDMSQRVGVAVKDLAKYDLATAQSGTSMEALAKGIKGMAGNLEEHGDALRKAGITATTADGAMQQLADVFAAMPDGMEKTTLAVKLFGKSGMDLIPMLNLGSAGLQAAADMSSDYAKQMAAAAPLADAFNDQLAQLALNAKTMGMTLANEALPTLNNIAEALSSIDTKPAVDAVMTVAGAVVPAAKVAAAYFAIFVAAPAVYAMTTAAMTPLIHATALHAYNMITGEAATIGLNTSLYGTSVAAQLAAGSLSKMALAGSVLFAAFAGWQFGTYLRDQFVEVRVAGLAFIGSMMSGWEHLKYGAQLAGAALKSLLPGTESFADAKARLSAQHAADIALIDQNIIELIQYETSVKRATATESAASAVKDEALKKAKALAAALKDKDNAEKASAKLAKERADAEKKALEDLARTAQALANIRNKEYDDIESYMRQESDRLAATALASEDAVRAAQAEYDNHGKLKSAIAETTLARLQDQLVNNTAGTEAYRSIDRQIAAQIKLIEILKRGEARTAAEDAVRGLAEVNKNAAEESGRYWEDALMRAFESGKGFFESLWDTIKNTLKTQALKILVTGVTGGFVQNAAASATGSAAAGAGGSMLGNAFTSMFPATSAAISTFGNAALAGIQSMVGMTGTVAQASTAVANGLAYAVNGVGSTAASAGSMFAAAAPWLVGAAALYAIAQATKGETRAGGQYGYSMDGLSAYNPRRGTSVTADGVGATYLEGPSGGDPYADVASSAINATVGHINALFKGMGSTASITAFGAGYETSDKNRGGVFAGGTLSGGITFGESGAGDNYAGTLYDSSKGFDHDTASAINAFSLDLKQSTIEALQAATDIPQAIADMIKVDAKALTDEAATALLTSIDALVTDVGTLGAVLDQLPFADLRDLGFDASAGLIKAAGSLQNLTSSLGSFYDNFYTDQEKTANLTNTTRDAFAALGITMPAISATSRDWYRTLVDSVMAQDMSVASNQTLLNNVLSLQGAMNTLAPAFADVEAGIKDLVAGISTRVDSSIFDMQYGMEDNPGKYNMINARATRLNDEMQASTDINAIAAMAEDQIALINQAWGLLSSEQQQAKYLEFEDRLEKIDEFVGAKGADAISLRQAENDAMATTIADALEVVMEKALAKSTAAMQAVADKAEKPIEVTSNVNLTVTAPVGSEVAINA